MAMMHWDAEIGPGLRRVGIKAITWDELEDVYGEDYDTENQTFSGDHQYNRVWDSLVKHI
jgi:hypothetical protein